ncbi:MAG: CHAT domain-containing tetratricopeptide repeat protein [Acidobacteriota bacterium]
MIGSILAGLGCGEASEAPRNSADTPSVSAPDSAVAGPLADDTPRPAPATPVEGELLGGGSHHYLVPAEAGEFLSFVVDQIGVDVVVKLIAPDGELLIRCDKPTGRSQTEEVLWVVGEPGDHLLTITALGAAEVPGSYRVRIDERRPATLTDRQRAVAERHYSEGERLRKSTVSTDHDLAETEIRAAMDVWRTLGDRARLAVGHYRLGQMQEDQEQAMSEFNAALQMMEDDSNAWLKATVLHWLGWLHFQKGDAQLAIALYQRALPLRHQAGDALGDARTLNNLGLSHQVLGESSQAVEYYSRALERYRQLNNFREEARTLHNLGKSYLSTGLTQEALDNFHQALRIRRQHDDIEGQASTLSAIGQAYTGQNDLDRSLEAHQEALKLSRQAGNRRLQAIALSDTAITNERLGHREQVLRLYQQALKIFEDLGDHRNAARTLNNIGWVLVERDEIERAGTFFDQALARLEATQNRHLRITGLRGKAEVERQRDRLLIARDLLEAALDEIEGLREEPHSRSLRYAYFATKQSYFDAYVDLLMELHRQQPQAGYDAQALTVSERARARSQLDALHESGLDLKRGADPQLRQRERLLEQEIETLEKQRLQFLELKGGAGSPQLAEIERRLRESFVEHGRVQGEIRGTSPQYAALTQPQPLGAAAIQQQVVDDETLLIEIDLGKDRSYLWVVTPDQIQSFVLPPARQIEQLAKMAYRGLSSDHHTASRQQTGLMLGRLSDLVIRPIAHLLTTQRLLIVTEGALQYIPFGALPLPEDHASDSDPAPAGQPQEPLAARHEIVSMPSASTLATLRKQLAKRPTGTTRIAVLADPVFSSNDPRLADPSAAEPASPSVRGTATLEPRTYDRLIFSRQEADDILRLVEPSESLAALGFEANREAVMNGRFASAQFLHFATHGELNTAHPELSRLIVSQVDAAGRPVNGFIFAHEIYNLELTADLVVLSACETALGAEIRGEGLLGLTQGFMYAGAASVIVSLWSVDDEATAELMASFYRKLLVDKQSPAAALRAAQMAIASEARWQAPYYWAGFILQGEWRLPIL